MIFRRDEIEKQVTSEDADLEKSGRTHQLGDAAVAPSRRIGDTSGGDVLNVSFLSEFHFLKISELLKNFQKTD